MRARKVLSVIRQTQIYLPDQIGLSNGQCVYRAIIRIYGAKLGFSAEYPEGDAGSFAGATHRWAPLGGRR